MRLLLCKLVLFDINKIFGQMIEVLEESGVSLKGVFLNADPGFDSNGFKKNVQKKR
jgi:hypothetical protein